MLLLFGDAVQTEKNFTLRVDLQQRTIRQFLKACLLRATPKQRTGKPVHVDASENFLFPFFSY
ncbi:hypothetical protein Ple7327_0673 [Pleurocapsa sp. PCC 7327]|nr:hypothetical protein Ple7327_0673 [Pleurocapsa sp. PCC 7327]